MKPIRYYIEFGTGKINKSERSKYANGFETYGYKTALIVARLLKQRELTAALMVANNGIEWHVEAKK